MAPMMDDVAKVLLDEATIQAKVRELAARIAEDYAGKELTLVCILKGAVLLRPTFCVLCPCRSRSISWPSRVTGEACGRRESCAS